MYSIGDKVQITIGTLDKLGLIGEIVSLFSNGAMVKLSDNKFTPIQFSHMEKLNIEDADVVDGNYFKEL